MCTLVILRRPDHSWPVLIGANRDEMIDRASKPPGRHWPDRPELVAGLDLLAGGSWLGINDWGVAAAVLNRHGSLDAAYTTAMQYADLARNAICGFPDTEIKRALLWAPEFVVAREK